LNIGRLALSNQLSGMDRTGDSWSSSFVAPAKALRHAHIAANRPTFPSPPPGAERGRVRWGTLQRQAQSLENTVEVFEHLVISKSGAADSRRLPARRNGHCRPRMPEHAVPIQLDRELSRGTGEVGDMTANRMLRSELPRQTARPKGAPEQRLPFSRLAPQPARYHGPPSQPHPPSSPTSPCPLRPRGRRGHYPRSWRKSGVRGLRAWRCGPCSSQGQALCAGFRGHDATNAPGQISDLHR
jgi:hypothetical protein